MTTICLKVSHSTGHQQWIGWGVSDRQQKRRCCPQPTANSPQPPDLIPRVHDTDLICCCASTLYLPPPSIHPSISCLIATGHVKSNAISLNSISSRCHHPRWLSAPSVGHHYGRCGVHRPQQHYQPQGPMAMWSGRWQRRGPITHWLLVLTTIAEVFLIR